MATNKRTQKQRTKMADRKRKTSSHSRTDARSFSKSTISSSYEEAVLRNIIQNPTKGVSDEAVLLSSTLSSMSKGMKELHYRSGLQVGKTLYSINTSSKSYMFPEESMADLVLFFEHSGYKNITYSTLQDNLEIVIHDTHSAKIGASIHSFEAGIISGYLSAAFGKYINIAESDCSNLDGRCCKFSARAANGGPGEYPAGADAINRAVEHIAQNVKHNSHSSKLSTGYYMLLSSLLFDKTYLSQIKEIAMYLGRAVGEKAGASTQSITNAIKKLNMGDPVVKSAKPLHIQVSFDPVNSKREFVDVALSFINGLISNRARYGLSAAEHSRNGSYVVDLKEMPRPPA